RQAGGSYGERWGLRSRLPIKSRHSEAASVSLILTRRKPSRGPSSHSIRKRPAPAGPSACGLFPIGRHNRLDCAKGLDDLVRNRSHSMHKYHVGQVLDLLPNRGSSSRKGGECSVVALLPFEGHAVQYRVQSTTESHQR